MIISRTPFRISFFGGGTDFPSWYKDHQGAVLATAIDKYCYINCRLLPQFFTYKHRIVYSRCEVADKIDEIAHPAVREVFRFMKVKDGLEIHHDGDLPARSGLGSSSSFTVGLLHALYALQGKIVSKKKLALDSIFVEQQMIKENVGSQDQVIVAFGGLNKITFIGNHNIEVSPMTISADRLNFFQEHLSLFFTGFTRIASDIEKDKMKKMESKKSELGALCSLVDEAIGVINGNGSLNPIGKMLDESWRIKRSFSDKVSNSEIDAIYQSARRAGALGGKLLGAGGGGFMLFFSPPGKKAKLKRALSKLLHVPFRFDSLGSQIIYYREEGT